MRFYVFSFFMCILQCKISYSTAELKLENDIINHLGTRTAYRFRFNKNMNIMKYPKCKDTKIWMLVRHGTRLPSAKDILGMNRTLYKIKQHIVLHSEIIKGELNRDQVKMFEEWSNNLNVNNNMWLTLEGQREMKYLAERTRKRFPNAIRRKYNRNSFWFGFTDTQRAHQSARYFAKGLFTQRDTQNVVFSDIKYNDHWRFYKKCEKWQKQAKKNTKDQILFAKSINMNRTLESVTKRLGLKRLTLVQIVLMYKACGYETSWNKYKISPWCYAFDKESAEALDYYHDLKLLRMYGYGHSVHACLALQSMYKMFKSDVEPYASFHFAHSSNLLQMLTHLQLYDPDRLTADVINKTRTFKASYIDSFASNLAFVLYRCEDGDYVLTLHQERPIILPLCDKELCPLKTVKKHF